MNSWSLDPKLLSKLILVESASEPNVVYVSSQLLPASKVCKPEELIRQLFYLKLHHEFNIPLTDLEIEYPIQIGSSRKRADIVYLNNRTPKCIIEVKTEIDNRSIDQLKSYMMVTNVSYGCLATSNVIQWYVLLNDKINELEVLPKDVIGTSFNSIKEKVKTVEIIKTKEIEVIKEVEVKDLNTNSSHSYPISKKKEAMNIYTAKDICQDLGITEIYLVDDDTSIIRIKNELYELPHHSLISYARFRNFMIKKTVVVSISVTKDQWTSFVSYFYENREEAKTEIKAKFNNNLEITEEEHYKEFYYKVKDFMENGKGKNLSRIHSTSLIESFIPKNLIKQKHYDTLKKYLISNGWELKKALRIGGYVTSGYQKVFNEDFLDNI